MDLKWQKIQHIIVRSFFEPLTEEEQMMMDQWRRESQAHERLYQKIHNTANLNKHLQDLEDIDIDRAFRQNQHQLKIRTTHRFIRRYGPYAAVLLLFLGCILLWPLAGNEPPLVVAEQNITPGGQKAELILADGSSVHLKPGMESHLKDGASEVVISGNGACYSSQSDTKEIVYHTIRTPLGGEYSVILADGSIVKLNAMSELKYPVNFMGNERRVELKGEAFFHIKRDTTRPFYVIAEGKQVKVLGTTFNLNAYPEETCISTTLCCGSVCFGDPKTPDFIFLRPGEQVNYDKKSNEYSVVQVDTDLFTAWTQGEFRFDNTRIDEIFNILQRWYPIEITYADQRVKAEVFTGKLPRFDDLQTILNIMEKVSDVKFEMKGNILIIK